MTMRVSINHESKENTANTVALNGRLTMYILWINKGLAIFVCCKMRLANLPTTKKKLKVLGDWISDLIFKPDVSKITRQERESGEEQV